MRIDRKTPAKLICGLLLSLGSNAAMAQQTPGEEERRRIEQKLDELNALKADLDARIQELQTEVRSLAPQLAPAKADGQPPPAPPAAQIDIAEPPGTVASQQNKTAPADKPEGVP